MFRSTLDIDNNRLGNGYIMRSTTRHALRKIQSCNSFIQGGYRLSASSNGYHFKLWCAEECILCRVLFDDSKRIDADRSRPTEGLEVLWDNKSYYKHGGTIVMQSGPWLEIDCKGTHTCDASKPVEHSRPL